MEWSDEELAANYLKGDEESLEVLIKRYLKPIYSFAYRYVRDSQCAEDIVQDVFVKVWRNLKGFDYLIIGKERSKPGFSESLKIPALIR